MRRPLRTWVGSWFAGGGGVLVTATLLLYGWLAPAHVSAIDNAELTTLGHVGGVAHPTGYPLYLIWLRATSWLPASTPAHAAALATAVLGAAQIGVLHAACRAWGARPFAATVATAVFAAGPIVMRHNSEAEVFALNGLVVATILWLAAAGGPLRGERRTAALALVAGLGLANHVTCVLAAPIGVLGAVRGVREAARPGRAVVLGASALALGLTPYAYLLAQPDTPTSWGTIDSAHALWRHFLREDYGGPGAFSPRGGLLDPAAQLRLLIREVGRVWLYAPLAGGVVALAVRVVRRAPTAVDGDRAVEPRAGWAMLALAIVLAGPVLVARFDMVPVGLNVYALRRFYLMPALLVAPAVAIALTHAGAYVARRVRSRLAQGPLACALAATLGLGAAAAPALAYVRGVHAPALQHLLEGTLRSLPPGSVLLHSQGSFHYGIGYLQQLEGARPDVTAVMWPQVGSAWYRARLARAGLVLDRPVRQLSSIYVAEVALATGRPLFVDEMQANILATFPTVPHGVVFRVLPRGTPRPPIEEVVRANEALFATFDLAYPRPGADEDFATAVHASYARTWRVLAEALAATGHREEAARAAAIGAALAPR